MNFPDKKYNIIYADPAWSYNENWGNGCVKHHYETTGIEQMKQLPVSDLSDDNCYLYMWYTNPFFANIKCSVHTLKSYPNPMIGVPSL